MLSIYKCCNKKAAKAIKPNENKDSNDSRHDRRCAVVQFLPVLEQWLGAIVVSSIAKSILAVERGGRLGLAFGGIGETKSESARFIARVVLFSKSGRKLEF